MKIRLCCRNCPISSLSICKSMRICIRISTPMTSTPSLTSATCRKTTKATPNSSSTPALSSYLSFLSLKTTSSNYQRPRPRSHTDIKGYGIHPILISTTSTCLFQSTARIVDTRVSSKLAGLRLQTKIFKNF